MISDARDLQDQAILHADLCIVGSGPAAMSVALSFEGTPFSVLLLEAGGPGREPNDDDARAADGMQFGNVSALTNVRSLGGNANLWNVQTDQSTRSVRLLPLTDADFEPRPWLVDSGWPVQAVEMAEYYRRAQVVFGLSDCGYAPEDWEEPWARTLPLGSPDVRTAMFQFADGSVFLDTHRQTLERSRNVTILHHATALEAQTDESAAHVTALQVASVPGCNFRVNAKHFILAMGGIGSAQLLLASDAVQPGGLGNAFGNVGRYLMDHPLLFGGEFMPASPNLFEAMDLYDLRSVRGSPVMGHLQLSDEALRREALLNLSAIFFPRERDYEAHRRLSRRQQAGFDAALRLRYALRHKAALSADDAWSVLKGIDGVAKRALDRIKFPKANLAHGGWSGLSRKAKRFDCFEVIHQAEQAPHHDNRVTLSQERNRFGARRVLVDWRWHDADIAATMRAQDLFARVLAKAGLGQFKTARESGRPVVLTTSTSHYLGTTRMHEDPKQGVVDGQCRVHGVDNLFIASSSVFPTGGFANPTLTIVALALRVADSIRAIHGLPDRVGRTDGQTGRVLEAMAAE